MLFSVSQNPVVGSEELSQSGNDSSASHSVNYSGKNERARGVQPVTSTHCAAVCAPMGTEVSTTGPHTQPE